MILNRHRTPRQSGRQPHDSTWALARPLAMASLVGVGAFIAAVVTMDATERAFSPLDDVVSYYVYGENGWLISAGAILFGLGILALAAALGGALRGPRARAVCWSVAVAGAGILTAGLVPADPPGNWSQPPSVADWVHWAGGMGFFLGLPLASLLLGRTVAGERRWSPATPVLRVLAVLIVLTLAAFMVSWGEMMLSGGAPVLLGLTERLLVGACAAWLVAAAAGLLRATSRHTGG